ncbi:MAG: cation diffusion facilitator family transporter [Porphyromonadaceae bacterium]|nr:cation diffusion facilitator family transporter [Porphyromonadaceae bacterium]
MGHHHHYGGHHHTHEHGHHHHHHHHHNAEGNILFAFLLNLSFSIIELVGGIITGSVAILSDALHDFGDSISLGLAWYLEKVSGRRRDKSFSYGYKRFSLLSALMISLILLVGSFFVIQASIERLFSPEMPNARGMLLLAIFGLVINGVAAWRMSGGHSLSERSIQLHLLEDVLGWAAVLIVSIVMHFVHLPILDPLLSLAITAWILYNVYFNLRDNFRILLQGVPEGVDTESFIRDVKALEHVVDVHDVHVWTLNGQEHIASLHIVHSLELCGDPKGLNELKHEVRHIALDHHGLEHLTIELDPQGESCGMEGC